jgi:DUF4097 and DUF4098 domain-containing protein YvlB
MRYPATAAVLLGALSTGCVVTVDSHSEVVREEKRFAVTGTPDVRVSTFDGSIQVTAWDKAEVLVEIEKRGPSKQSIDELVVSATETGGVIEVAVKRPRAESFNGFGIHRSADARLIVSVPRRANLRVRSEDGGIRVDGVSGQLDLRTDDGSIRASDISGEMTIDTGDGSVTVMNADGRLAVETSDGSVSVSGTLAAVKLHTGDGSVSYRAAPGSTMADDWEITTGDGGVSVYLPAEFSARIDAHTGDGRITNDLRVDQLEKSDDQERTRRTLRGTLGSGGKLLRVRTGDGSIRLKLN